MGIWPFGARATSRSVERLLGVVLVWLAASVGGLRADEPLHRRIDALIAARMNGPAAERTSDAEFVRRVYLDLAGRIPTVDETRSFLADGAAEKRATLVDRLLASPDYPRRMSDLLNVMLMERLGENPDWSRYLHQAAVENKSWDRMVREMLYSDPTDAATRGAQFFLSKRLENYGQNPVDYPALVRDVGRLFLGMDVQCSQCHDHLFVKEYTQDYFQGLFAFLGQTYLRTDLKTPAVAEKLVDKKVGFTSVFIQQPRETGPRLPGGAELAVPTLAKGEEWELPPDRKTNFPGRPKFSPLRALAEQLPRAETAPFSRNAVNRLWWMLMGRGLVHPLDLHHGENPASHPELLDLLAAEFTSHQFDVKWLLRELALTEVYQRASWAPASFDPNDAPPESYRVALEKPLSSEQLLASVLVASGRWARHSASALAAPPGSADGKPPEATEFDKLRERFQKAIANPPREPEVEFAPSVKAALFLSNDSTVLGWLQPTDGALAERLVAQTDSAALVDELYVAVLSRPATVEERDEAIGRLAAAGDKRPAAIGRLIWALLNSTEFSLNH